MLCGDILCYFIDRILIFIQGTIFGTCFELLEPPEMLMLYITCNPGEYHQSVYTHHHYKAVHLAERPHPLMLNYLL